jgi:uncharacterized membrane protein
MSRSGKAAGLMPAGRRALIVFVVGITVGLMAGAGAGWPFAPIIGWDAAALFYAGWTWSAIWPLSSGQTADLALREDPGRAATDAALVTASLASLVGVGLLIIEAARVNGGWERVAIIGLSIASVILSWLLVHTIFALHYARLYYTPPRGGIDFNEAQPPSYVDFAYLAFTIGMTFQVSDTNLSARALRATALRHALLSYVFGTVIVALTINLVAGLGK